MVASDGDAAAAAVRDLLSRLLDCAWHVIGGGSAADASTGHVHGGPRRSELDRDASARTAAGASHEGNDVVQAPLGIRLVVHAFFLVGRNHGEFPRSVRRNRSSGSTERSGSTEKT